ncbi:MAG: hypothetical protein ACH346_01145, partial [Chthoniobacterales bacterium]
DNAGDGKLWAAKQLEKAIEAEAANNPALAQAWREAAAENQKSSEYFLKAGEAKAIGTPEKTNEGNSWDNAGLGKLRAAKQLEKAIEAEAANNPTLAQAWRRAAGSNRQASDYWISATRERARGNNEGPTGAAYWDREALKKYNEAKALADEIESGRK